MTISDHIEKWLEEQIEAGRERDEIAGTYFSYKDTIAVIKKSGKTKYKLEIFLNPRAVAFKD